MSAALQLTGVRVVVTRAQEQADAFRDALEAAGAEVRVRPLIRIEAPERPALLPAAIRSIQEYDWIIFTSANAVDRFVDALKTAHRDAQDVQARVAAVGPSTAATLESRGIEVEVLPAEFTAEAVTAALVANANLAGARVLWPRANTARIELARQLERHGAVVDAVEAYKITPDYSAGAALREEVAAGDVDAVTFTSPSTVQAFAAEGVPALGRTRIATIGPVTAAEARRLGLPVHIEPVEHTTASLVAALERYFNDERHAGASQREG